MHIYFVSLTRLNEFMAWFYEMKRKSMIWRNERTFFYDIWNIFTLQGLQSKWKKILNKKTYLLVQNFGSDEEFCLNIEACKVRASVLRCPLKNKMFVSNGRWGLFFFSFLPNLYPWSNKNPASGLLKSFKRQWLISNHWIHIFTLKCLEFMR